MREYKIIVLGSMGAGKTTLVRAVANGTVIDTDVDNTDSGSAKLTTTVAMDYGDVDLPNGDRLRLYGSPGQGRFDFVWPVLLEGATGVVVLVDASTAEEADRFENYLDVLEQHAANVPCVMGLVKLDLAPQASPDDYYNRLEARGRTLPLIPLDPRDEEQVMMLMDALMGEIESADLVANP